MKVALYAIRRKDSRHVMPPSPSNTSTQGGKANGKWELFISLNMYLDIVWWSHWEEWHEYEHQKQQSKSPKKTKQSKQSKQLHHKQQLEQEKQNHHNRKFEQQKPANQPFLEKAPPVAMLLLSSDLPLGWAVMLRDNFKSQSKMDQWTSPVWLQYLKEQLQPLMKEETVALEQNLASHKGDRSDGNDRVNRDDRDNRDARDDRDAGNAGNARDARNNRNDRGDRKDKKDREDKKDEQDENVETDSSTISDHTDSTNKLDMPVWLWSLNHGLTIQGKAMISETMEPQQIYAKDFSHLLLENEGLNLTVVDNIETYSARLSAMLAGRSLLEQELIVLLKGSDELEELAAYTQQGGGAMPLRGAWRLLVQHAQLRGRVVLTSAVAVTHSRPMGASDHNAAPVYRRLHSLRPAALLKWAARRKLVYRCRRCGSGVHVRTPCGSCGSLCCAYCEACLTLGRSRTCALLVQGSAHMAVPLSAQRKPIPTPSILDRWGLSPAQRAAAGAALDFLQGTPSAEPASNVAPVAHASFVRSLLPKSTIVLQPNRFLLWAVTGAGKTEMIFPLIAYVLEQGGKALVATPRRDVVLELSPRLKTAFPEADIATLYGGSPERFKQGNLVIATTHQLMRFAYCFDLVVIDELDAFPYHNDPMLAYAATQCCKPHGKYILLSATPPIMLQKEVGKGILPHAKVPARFHGHPLPVPRHIGIKGVEVALRTKQLPSALITSLRKSVQRGAQIFIFVAHIRHISPLIAVLKRYFPALAIEGTSSEDADRAEKVLQFRACTIRMLVTTTILERGVTVKKSDVYIFDADSDLFDEASLVQMAGRAGRSSDDPAGLVVFSSLDWTTSQRKAIAQIKQMNTLARKRGYLKR